MTNEIAVSAQKLSKMYLLYNKPVDRLKQSLFKYFGKDYARVFWALHDVSFSVKRGQAFGIIGRNGSGKSTLLQIVAGTLQPTGGDFQANGRLAAILELGAGFNVEFSGRENIYINGATLGISEKQMRKHIDEIIDFAHIGEFIDQPVKFYSSGMFVRLAFAIATSIDPDILLVDEALAVGDAGFVIKCMNRMKQMREKGCTIVLVTHDVQTVRSFCDEAMWLHEGRTEALGKPAEITGRYLQYLFEEQKKTETSTGQPKIDYSSHTNTEVGLLHRLDMRNDLVRWGSGEIQVEAFSIGSEGEFGQVVFEYGQMIQVDFIARATRTIPSTAIGFGIAFRNTKGLDIITCTTYEQDIQIPPLREGQVVHLCFTLENILAPGSYALVINAEARDQAQATYFDFIENATIFTVVSSRHIYSLVLPKYSVKMNIE